MGLTRSQTGWRYSVGVQRHAQQGRRNEVRIDTPPRAVECVAAPPVAVGRKYPVAAVEKEAIGVDIGGHENRVAAHRHKARAAVEVERAMPRSASPLGGA